MLVVLLAAAEARAEGVAATVDRTDVGADEPLTLTVSVDGSQSAEPQLPDLAAFEVHSRGRATQVQIINGHLSTGATYTYLLVPRRPGTFPIGAVRATWGGHEHASEPFSVTVRDAAAGAGGAAPASGSGLSVSGQLSSEAAYVGQQVVYTWRFSRRQRIANAQVSLPDFDGFVSEPLGEQREFEITQQGRATHVVEMRRALFPQEAGTLEVPASSLQCEVFVGDGRGDGLGGPFDDFFGRGQRLRRTLRSEPLRLQVRALPLPLPADFSGLVGDFTIAAALSTAHLQVGESATLTVTVSGNGALQHLGDPATATLPDLKVYDDRPVTQVNARGAQLSGTKVFKKALVPTRAGRLEVPAFRLTFFDPLGQAYRTVASAPLALEVAAASGDGRGAAAGGGGGAAAPATKVDVALEGDDILPQYVRLDALGERRMGPRQGLGWAALFATPALGHAALAFWLRGRGDPSVAVGRRRRRALREATRRAAEVGRALEAGRVGEAASLTSRALRTYLGVKLQLEGGALTPAEARAHLEARRCSAPLAGAVEALLWRCEGAQYSAAPGTVSLYTNLATELRALLGRLDRELRSP